jgi:Sucrase/ferredoxin-like
MLSASNMPIPHSDLEDESATRCILLPAFITIDNVTPSTIPDLITQVINPTSTSVSPLPTSSETNSLSHIALPENSPFKVSACPHDYLILLCSHKTRDARCGQSAPLLRKEFERHLRPLGLLRDLHDERPGGVGIYFINHVGGHKFAANVIIYRRAGTAGAEKPLEIIPSAQPAPIVEVDTVVVNGEQPNGEQPNGEQPNGEQPNGEQPNGVSLEVVNGEKEEIHPAEAGQCIWLARVRPEDCENIIRYTVLQGKVVKPERQLRGGFDRCKQLASW